MTAAKMAAVKKNASSTGKTDVLGRSDHYYYFIRAMSTFIFG
jgi:hypothetical protein